VPLGELIHAECDACGAQRGANCDFQEHALVRRTVHTVTKNTKGHNHHIPLDPLLYFVCRTFYRSPTIGQFSNNTLSPPQ
jgi:hypothetical protein